MNGKKESRDANRGTNSDSLPDEPSLMGSSSEPSDAVTILDERLHNLREAIEEIDAALARRKVLNVRFLDQIDRET